MAQDVRIIVLNTEEAYGPQLRAQLMQIPGLKIVAEMDEAALLGQAVKQFPVDIVFVNLDPSPTAILPTIAELIAADSSLVVFAASASTDGPLILQTIRTGVKEFLPKPIDTKTLTEAIDKVATSRRDTKELGKLVTVLGTSGGVGASVLATNLATELAALARGDVTIVDLDYRYGQVATLLDVDPTYSLADLCHSPEQLESQVIERAVVTHASGVKVLSRPATLSQADTMTAASCVGLFTTLAQFNEYIVADGPHRSDVHAKSVFDLSDVNLLLVQQVVPAVRNAARILDNMRSEGYQMDRVKLVCNRVGRDSGALSLDDIAETLGLPVFASIPDDWPTVSGAINLGETLQNFSPKSKVRQSVQEIAERLHTPVAQSDDKNAHKKGLIGRIFAGT